MQHSEVICECCFRKNDLSHKLNTQRDMGDGSPDLIPRPKKPLTFIWLSERPLEGQIELRAARVVSPLPLWERGMLLHKGNNTVFFTKHTLLPRMRIQRYYVFNCKEQKVKDDSAQSIQNLHAKALKCDQDERLLIIPFHSICTHGSESQSLNAPLKDKILSSLIFSKYFLLQH